MIITDIEKKFIANHLKILYLKGVHFYDFARNMDIYTNNYVIEHIRYNFIFNTIGFVLIFGNVSKTLEIGDDILISYRREIKFKKI